MSICVVDASMAAAWCLPGEDSSAMAWLDFVAKEGALVPALWPFEISNVLLVAERRRRIQETDVVEARNLIAQLPLAIEPPPTQRATSEIMQLARRYALSFYDASYLESAIRNHLPLGTFDEPLRKAAKACGVRLTVT